VERPLQPYSCRLTCIPIGSIFNQQTCMIGTRPRSDDAQIDSILIGEKLNPEIKTATPAERSRCPATTGRRGRFPLMGRAGDGNTTTQNHPRMTDSNGAIAVETLMMIARGPMTGASKQLQITPAVPAATETCVTDCLTNISGESVDIESAHGQVTAIAHALRLPRSADAHLASHSPHREDLVRLCRRRMSLSAVSAESKAKRPHRKNRNRTTNLLVY